MIWLTKVLVTLVTVSSLAGCAAFSTPPPMQWWRVGNCLVIYDMRDNNRKVLVAGQQCEIKREEMAAVSGTTP